MPTVFPHSTSQSQNVFFRLQRLASQAAARFTAMRARRATYRRAFDELCQMTDRELASVGITRHDIRRIAAEEAALAHPNL